MALAVAPRDADRTVRSRTALPPYFPSPLETAIWVLVVAGAVLLPVVISPRGEDTFRLPKEILMRGEAILLAGLTIIALLAKDRFDKRLPSRPITALLVAIVAWTSFVTWTSTNHALSLPSLGRTIVVAVIFLAIFIAARPRGVSALVPLLAAGAANGILFLLQELKIWNPFRFEYYAVGHAQSTAFLGNPNDVGSFLVVPALTSLAVCLLVQRGRVISAAATIILSVALVSTLTMTAVFAFAAGAAMLVWLRFPRYRVVAASVLTLAFALALSTYAPLRQRTARILDNLSTGNIDGVISSRSAAFAAAWDMWRDHPFTGIGPGTFSWHYFPYKLAAEESYPPLLDSQLRGINFGEVHSDHLQVLAEAGWPGYVLMVCAIVLLARRSRDVLRNRTAGVWLERRRVAEYLALPLAVSFAVLAVAQFPLQLAACTYAYIYVAALCLSWTEERQA